MPDLDFRRAVPSDADTLFRWANDETTRANSFSQEPIPWETHVAWFGGKLADPNTVIFVASSNHSPVGQARVDVDNRGYGLVDISVGSEFRGRGYGSVILAALPNLLKTYPMCKTLRACVKHGNSASARIFRRAGFSLREEKEGYSVYEMALAVVQ